jgi:hypothetical protein
VLRTKEERALKRALKGSKDWRRPVGRPRGKWMDAVDKDAKSMLKFTNWRRSAEVTIIWRRRTGEAKTQVGQWRHRISRKMGGGGEEEKKNSFLHGH